MSFSDREPRRLDSESESLRLPRACTATPGKVTPSGPTYGSHARRGAGKGLRVGVPVVVTVTRSKCPRLRPRVTRCTGAFTWSASSRCRRTSFTSAERLVEARPRELIDRVRAERRERGDPVDLDVVRVRSRLRRQRQLLLLLRRRRRQRGRRRDDGQLVGRRRCWRRRHQLLLRGLPPRRRRQRCRERRRRSGEERGRDPRRVSTGGAAGPHKRSRRDQVTDRRPLSTSERLVS